VQWWNHREYFVKESPTVHMHAAAVAAPGGKNFLLRSSLFGFNLCQWNSADINLFLGKFTRPEDSFQWNWWWGGLRSCKWWCFMKVGNQQKTCFNWCWSKKNQSWHDGDQSWKTASNRWWTNNASHVSALKSRKESFASLWLQLLIRNLIFSSYPRR
jgi:hypothetical protein